MKNVGHIAAKNVLVLAIASIVYYLVGFGIAFGDGGNGLVGGSGFVPVGRRAARGRRGAVQLVLGDPRRGRLPVRGRLLRASRSRSSGARWPSGRALGLLRLRRRLHADLLGRLALDLEPGRLALRDAACRTSPARRSSTTRARSPASPARCCSARASASSGTDGKPNAIPGHNMAFTTLGVIILWFGWFGFNPGSTLSVDFGGVGFFSYVALNTNIAAAAGVLGAVRHVVARDQEARPLDDAERRDRRARRDHGRVRVRRPVGGDRDRLRRRRDRRRSACCSSSGSASTTRSARSPRTAWPASGARSRSAS